MDSDLFLYIGIGFLAQIVDGAIGMAFGVISTSVLLATGTAPAAASAAVHFAKVFTGLVSGVSHLVYRNVDARLCWRIALWGIPGATLGAALVSVANTAILRPVIAAYLLVIGLFLISRFFFHHARPRANLNHVSAAGFFGGLIDALGGGWGPIVTSTLLSIGHPPRFVIGTVNLAEVLVSVASSMVFATMIGLGQWRVALGLIIGGAVAAPFAASLTRRIPGRVLLLLVGALVFGLGVRILFYT